MKTYIITLLSIIVVLLSSCSTNYYKVEADSMVASGAGKYTKDSVIIWRNGGYQKVPVFVKCGRTYAPYTTSSEEIIYEAVK